MKSIIFGMLTMLAAVHPASSFVDDTLTEAQSILVLKDADQRTEKLCSLFKSRLASDAIAEQWLGKYASLTRDQKAIDQFRQMVPSIVMTKANPVLGAGVEGGFKVNDQARSRTAQTFEVDVTVTSRGKDYIGTAIVYFENNQYKLLDAEYNGYSVMDYQGREYRKFLESEYNRDPANSMPVTALVETIQAQQDYVSCP